MTEPKSTDIALRPMRYDDLPSVSRWLDEPHVRQWWVADASDLPTVEAEYRPRIDGTEPTEMFVITEAERAIGMIQRYLITSDADWSRTLSGITRVENAAGIDYLVGDPGEVNRGVGSDAISMFVPMVYDRWPVDTIVVAVQQANRASWRALERAGFSRAWAGLLDSPDPSDSGPAYVYVHRRPTHPDDPAMPPTRPFRCGQCLCRR